jgi:hypothetical protein
LRLPDAGEETALASNREKKCRSITRTVLYDSLVTFMSAKKPPPVLYRAAQKLDDAQHFSKQRANFAYATGHEIGPEPVEATLQIRDIRRQKDLRQRLTFILRKRVLLTFEEILKLQATDLGEQENALVSTIQASKVFATLQEQERISVDVPAASLNSTNRSAALGVEDATPRILLYLGPRGNQDFEWPAAPSFLARCHNNTNPQVPPMLPLLSSASLQAFPVFPIGFMLDANQLDNLYEVLKRYSVFSAEVLDSISRKTDEARFVMLKPGSENQTVAFERFVRNIWRLWRYGGGRRWLETKER